MDWNNDGKQDLISGDAKGQVWLFLNEGTKEKPVLAKGVRIEAAGHPISGIAEDQSGMKPAVRKLTKTYSWLHMGDWDGDDLKDLLVGHDDSLVFYRNVGTLSEPRFAEPVLVEFALGRSPSRPSAKIIDWDGDGKQDLLLGSSGTEIYLCRNSGTNEKPRLELRKQLELHGKGYESGFGYRVEATDWNNDGKRDLLVGTCFTKDEGGRNMVYGNIWLFLGE